MRPADHPRPPRRLLVAGLVGLVATSVLVPEPLRHASAAPSSFSPHNGAAQVTVTLPTDASAATAFTVTNPDPNDVATLALPLLTLFEWTGITGQCTGDATVGFPTQSDQLVEIAAGGTCAVAARVLATPAPGSGGSGFRGDVFLFSAIGTETARYLFLAEAPPAAPPANDALSAAQDISSVAVPAYAGGSSGPTTVATIPGTVVSATLEPGEFASGTNDGSVWFRYTSSFAGRLGFRTSTVPVQPYMAAPGVGTVSSVADLTDPGRGTSSPWNLDDVWVEPGHTIWFRVANENDNPQTSFDLELFQAPDPAEDIALARRPFGITPAPVPPTGSLGFGGGGSTFGLDDDLGDGTAVTWATLLFDEPVTFSGFAASVTAARQPSTRPLRVRVFGSPSTSSTPTIAELGAPLFDATSSTNTANLPLLAPGGQVATVPATPLAPGRYYLAVSSSAANPVFFVDNFRWSAIAVPPPTSADLSLAWDGTEPIEAGITTPVTLNVRNTGPDATSVTVRITAASGVELVAPYPDGYDPTTGRLAIADVPAASTTMPFFNVRMRLSGDPSLTAEVVAAGATDPDSTPDNGVATEDDLATTTIGRVPPTADALITAAFLFTGVEPPDPRIADSVTAEVGVGNSGPQPVTVDVRVTLRRLALAPGVTLPAGFDATTGIWTTTLDPFEQAVVFLPLIVTDAGVASLTAEIVGASLPDPDSTPGNGVATEDDIRTFELATRAYRADLSLQWTAPAEALLPGEEQTALLEVANSGPDRAALTEVRIVVPSGVEIVAPYPDGYDPTSAVWSVPSLDPGTTTSTSFQVRMGAAGPTDVDAFIASASDGDPDSTPGNGVSLGEDDADRLPLRRVIPSADLELDSPAITSLLAEPSVGDPLSAVLTIANLGPQIATATVRITLDGVTIPSGTTLPAGVDALASTWTVTVPSVDQRTIELPLVATRPGTASVTIEVVSSSADDPDSTPGNGDVADEDDDASGRIVIAAPVTRFSLEVSDRAGRGASRPLAGTTVSGSVAIFVPRDPAITQVEFFLDDPPMSGPARQTERLAPWDFAGTAGNGRATLFSTRSLSDGTHTVTARVSLRDGSQQVTTATFTVANPRPATRQLLVSTRAGRGGAIGLDGATVTGPVAVFVPNESGIVSVDYLLDGTTVRTERFTPWDFGGTAGNGQAQRVVFPVGARTVTAVITFRDGFVDSLTARFTAT